MNECDICGSKKNVVAGRWIWYCPKHKNKDWELTKENELSSGGDSFADISDVEHALSDGELSEMVLGNLL